MMELTVVIAVIWVACGVLAWGHVYGYGAKMLDEFRDHPSPEVRRIVEDLNSWSEWVTVVAVSIGTGLGYLDIRQVGYVLDEVVPVKYCLALIAERESAT